MPGPEPCASVKGGAVCVCACGGGGLKSFPEALACFADAEANICAGNPDAPRVWASLPLPSPLGTPTAAAPDLRTES